MGTSLILSIIVSVTSVGIAGWALFYNAKQTKSLAQGLKFDQQAKLGEATIHFTTRFMDLVKDANPKDRFEDERWAYRFWSLMAAEFYFFHHSMLPVFMFKLWIFDLGKMYKENPKIWESHEKYLLVYSIGYGEMETFFRQVYKKSTNTGSLTERNTILSNYIDEWFSGNMRIVDHQNF